MLRRSILIVMIPLVSVSALLAEGPAVQQPKSKTAAAAYSFVSTGGLVAFSMIYDIATVGKSVDKYNVRHGFSEVRLRPTYFVRQGAPGIMLTVSL